MYCHRRGYARSLSIFIHQYFYIDASYILNGTICHYQCYPACLSKIRRWEEIIFEAEILFSEPAYQDSIESILVGLHLERQLFLIRH